MDSRRPEPGKGKISKEQGGKDIREGPREEGSDFFFKGKSGSRRGTQALSPLDRKTSKNDKRIISESKVAKDTRPPGVGHRLESELQGKQTLLDKLRTIKRRQKKTANSLFRWIGLRPR